MVLANLCVSFIMTSQNEKAEDLLRQARLRATPRTHTHTHGTHARTHHARPRAHTAPSPSPDGVRGLDLS